VYDTFSNIENLTVGGGADVVGDANGNVITILDTGTSNSNTISSGGGNDTVSAGIGNDVINGGAGNDSLAGGGGADTFVLDSLIGSDTITDFTSGLDKLSISRTAIPIGDGDGVVERAVSLFGPGGFATTAELVIVTGDILGAIDATSAAAAIGSASAAYLVGQSVLFTVDNGVNSALFLFGALDADAFVEFNELTLLATLGNTPSTQIMDYVWGN
jgi:Ca2+-binding RTX toxin-like protein